MTKFAPCVTPEIRAEVLRLRNDSSMSQTAIAAQVHVSHSTVNQIFSSAKAIDGFSIHPGQRHRRLLRSTLPALPSQGGKFEF